MDEKDLKIIIKLPIEAFVLRKILDAFVCDEELGSVVMVASAKEGLCIFVKNEV